MSARDSSNPAYRPEIDGLRALAVIPIVLFHIGFPGLDGGFVGVDIFFVISGYLITGILARELTAGEFSLSRFYERRIRRILPALFVLLAATAVAGWLILLPEDLSQLGKSIIATLVFTSNFLFARQVDYFAAPALFKPLLHCWSLAVEEQFYLFFPPLLAGLWRFGRRWVIFALVIVAALSLAFAQYQLAQAPQNAFFWSPGRAWELLAGSLLALGAIPAVRAGLLREALAALGIILIAASVMLYRETMPFPGLSAVPPVLGSALVLHCASGTRAGALLELLPLRVVGWISYSLYLWHWPVVVYITYATGPMDWPTMIGAFVMCLVLSALSWRFVEEPFRRGTALRGLKALLFAGAGSAAIGAAALALVVFAGFPQRLDAKVRQLADATEDFSPRRSECHSGPGRLIPVREACTYGAATAPSAAYWGDSSGVEPVFAIGEVARQQGQALLHFTHSACSPTVIANPRTDPTCQAFGKAALAFLSSASAPQTIILSANSDSDAYRADPVTDTGFYAAVRAIRAAGKRVIVIGPVPNYANDVPRTVALAWQAQPGTATDGVETSTFLARNQLAMSRLARLESEGVTVIYPHRLLCRETCDVVRDGKVLYFDDHHLSVAGSRILAPAVAAAIWPGQPASQ